jgi:hypothetical protein
MSKEMAALNNAAFCFVIQYDWGNYSQEMESGPKIKRLASVIWTGSAIL